jgi:predicted Fe-S protein YdhL (DUF1289 family)
MDKEHQEVLKHLAKRRVRHRKPKDNQKKTPPQNGEKVDPK